MPKAIEKEKIDWISSVVKFLFWTTAGPIPAPLKILKKEIKTVINAITPNSEGDNNLAKIAPITMEITMPEYRVMAV